MFEYRRKNDDVFDDDTTPVIRCYETHPSLKVGKGTLIGGSASHPMVKDADAYVSLQSGSASGKSSDPWDPPGVVEIFYAISDMQPPTNIPRFQKMVTWVCNQLQKGKTVHVGCIGGHGRTGVVLSAIVAEALSKKDAIQWVRKHYCAKAVESRAQVQFLVKHYGVTEVAPAKEPKPLLKPYSDAPEWTTTKSISTSKGTLYERVEAEMHEPAAKPRKLLPEGATARSKAYEPMLSGRSLWNRKKKKSLTN